MLVALVEGAPPARPPVASGSGQLRPSVPSRLRRGALLLPSGKSD
jgi:hypothetical protein